VSPWRPTAALLFHLYPSEESFRHSIGLQLYVGISGGLPPDFLFNFPCTVILLSECALLICSYASCLHLLYLMSELSCEYFHSTHLACWFGQMSTKAISWMKSLIVSSTPRGIPVSPVRSWIPMNSLERQKDMTLKDELPRLVGTQYAPGDQWRNNSRKNEEMEPR